MLARARETLAFETRHAQRYTAPSHHPAATARTAPPYQRRAVANEDLGEDDLNKPCAARPPGTCCWRGDICFANSPPLAVSRRRKHLKEQRAGVRCTAT